MKNDFFIALKGTLSAEQSSNKAIRFDELKNLEGQTLLRSVYLPQSQLDSIKVTNKTKRELTFRIPEWLWKTKLEDEQSRQIDNSGFDQITMLIQSDANKQFAEKVTDRLVDEG